MHSLNLNSLRRKANYHRPLIFNSVLWSLAFVILIFIFSKGQLPIAVDYIYTLTFLVLLALPVSINFYILIPQFLKHEKYLFYSIGLALNLFVLGFLSSWLLLPILDLLFPNYFFVSYLSKQDIFLVFTLFLITTTLLKIV